MPHACVQRFSGNNFPVTFKRGLRSVEEQRNEAKRSERERERERIRGCRGLRRNVVAVDRPTHAKLRHRRRILPPHPLFPCLPLRAFSLAAHQTRAISFPHIFPPSPPPQPRDAGCVRSSEERSPSIFFYLSRRLPRRSYRSRGKIRDSVRLCT